MRRWILGLAGREHSPLSDWYAERVFMCELWCRRHGVAADYGLLWWGLLLAPLAVTLVVGCAVHARGRSQRTPPDAF